MKKYFNSNVGRLRVISFLEGASLVLLVVIGMPLKYWLGAPELVKVLGPIHGGLFMLFVANTLTVSLEHNWKFFQVTWKVLLSCLIPFANFYIDAALLKPMHDEQLEAKG